jgi:PAS domain S-box-containing protein
VIAVALVPFISAGRRHLLLVANDVSEQRRAEAALRRSEERLRLVLEATDQGIWDWDLATGERHVSPAFHGLLGVSSGEETLELDALLDRLVPEDAACVRQALADDGGDVRELEVRVRLAEGASRWLLARGRVLARDEGGAARRVVGTISDATGRKRAEEERRRFDERMRHAQQLESLGVLAGGIAHDFNNLLAAILANADLALLELPPGPAGREPLKAIASATWRAAELCRQMLAYAGKGQLSVAPVDLRELVREMLQILQASISKKAALSWRPPARLPAVDVDASQLRQVVMSLVLNASEALGGASGTIDVMAGVVECDRAMLARTVLGQERRPGTYVFLEVADTGCGMDPETQAHMFEPFFTTKFMGRGLGMAAVLGIVRGHRGTIEVESHVGRGTRLRVLLPPSEATVAGEPAAAIAEPERWGCGTVLVADDEVEVRKAAAAMLARMGFEPLEARDGREALELFRARQGEIACVLLDLTMPVMDGLEALEEIRRLAATTPVVVMSGYGEEHAQARLAAHEGVVFIAKPYPSSALADALRRALGCARPSS